MGEKRRASQEELIGKEKLHSGRLRRPLRWVNRKSFVAGSRSRGDLLEGLFGQLPLFDDSPTVDLGQWDVPDKCFPFRPHLSGGDWTVVTESDWCATILFLPGEY
jgi:hypothetical protein